MRRSDASLSCGRKMHFIRATDKADSDQRWRKGLNEVQVMNAFGVRIVIRPNGTKKDEEITEDDFRQRFTFVADR